MTNQDDLITRSELRIDIVCEDALSAIVHSRAASGEKNIPELNRDCLAANTELNRARSRLVSRVSRRGRQSDLLHLIGGSGCSKGDAAWIKRCLVAISGDASFRRGPRGR